MEAIREWWGHILLSGFSLPCISRTANLHRMTNQTRRAGMRKWESENNMSRARRLKMSRSFKLIGYIALGFFFLWLAYGQAELLLAEIKTRRLRIIGPAFLTACWLLLAFGCWIGPVLYMVKLFTTRFKIKTKSRCLR